MSKSRQREHHSGSGNILGDEDTEVQHAIPDFTQTLRAAIREARAAGLDGAAAQFEGRCFAASTTSSEWLGEVGLAITEFRRSAGIAVPAQVDEKLEACLREVRKVWPGV